MTRWLVVGLAACGPDARPAPAAIETVSPPPSCGATPDPSVAIPAAMYAPLFDDGAQLAYHGTAIGEEDDTGLAFDCTVRDVRRYPQAVGARLTCTADDLPIAGTPAGNYVATADGLFRVRELPAAGATPVVDPTLLMIQPVGAAQVLEGDGETAGQWIRRSDEARWCHDEVRGSVWDGDGLSVSICFRPGGGIVAGGYAIADARTDALSRGRWALGGFGARDAEPLPDVASARPALAINEIATDDDWFEVVNVTDRAVVLDDFVYTDTPQDLARAIAFPRLSLGPGAYHVQQVDDDVSGFRLAGDESLTIYRRAEHTVEDELAWDEGDAPAGGSFARVPDRHGAFRSLRPATPCAPNHE